MSDSGSKSPQRFEPLGLLQAVFQFPFLGDVFFIIDDAFHITIGIQDREGVVVIVPAPSWMGTFPLHGLSPPEAGPNRAFRGRLILPVENFGILLSDEVSPAFHKPFRWFD